MPAKSLRHFFLAFTVARSRPQCLQPLSLFLWDQKTRTSCAEEKTPKSFSLLGSGCRTQDQVHGLRASAPSPNRPAGSAYGVDCVSWKANLKPICLPQPFRDAGEPCVDPLALPVLRLARVKAQSRLLFRLCATQAERVQEETAK